MKIKLMVKKMKGNTQLRQENIKKVLRTIRQHGPVSKRELQKHTGFSWGNVSLITTLLANEGFIVASGKQDTGVGRKPEEFDININDNYILGIDFNSESVLAVVCDLRGRVVSSRHTLFKEKTKISALNELYLTIENLLSENIGKNISYIALAMQGKVDIERGISVKISEIEGWRDIAVCELVENRFHIKTVMLHDPDCLLYSEKCFGRLRDTEISNAVLLRIDHGIGIACMLGGKMYMGNRERTCEIGTTAVPTKNGWELVKNIVKEKAVENKYRALTNRTYSCAEIAAFAQKGDEQAKEIFSDLGETLGFAINNTVSLFNPDIIILYGSFAKYGDLFLEETESLLKKLCENEIVPIKFSGLDDKAAAVGATLFAADKVIEELTIID